MSAPSGSSVLYILRKSNILLYSRKMSNNLNEHVKPLIEAGGKYDGKVKVIIRLQVQPWHGSSTFVHEIALAVGFVRPLSRGRITPDSNECHTFSQVARICPQKFWEFHLALMNGQEDFYDIPSSTRTPVQTRAKLIELALPIVGQDKKEELTALLDHKTTPNGGNDVTNDLKYTSLFGPSFAVKTPLTF